MKKRVTSGWVLSFSSEEALLQAVRTLVKEEGVFWEVCAPYPCAAVRLANRHAGRAVGAGVRLWAAAGGVCGFLAVALCFTGRSSVRTLSSPRAGCRAGTTGPRTFPPCLKGPCSGPDF